MRVDKGHMRHETGIILGGQGPKRENRGSRGVGNLGERRATKTHLV